MKPTWRDLITVHPSADKFPMMSDSELQELAEDIKAHGQRDPVLLTIVNDKKVLVDGRNRLAACFLIKQQAASEIVNFEDAVAVESFVISRNIHRRHLTPAHRASLLLDLIKARPETSDRELGRQLKVEHTTIGRARRKLESTGALAPVEKRKGKDGKVRKAPAKKNPPATKKKPDALAGLATGLNTAIFGKPAGNGFSATSSTTSTTEESAEAMRAKFAALDGVEAAQPENAWIEIKTFLDARLPKLLTADKQQLFTYINNHPALATVIDRPEGSYAIHQTAKDLKHA